MALVFDGIKRLDIVGGGMFKIYWNAATGGTVESYNIYIRNGDSSIFTSTFLLRKIESNLLNAFVRVEADGITYLINGDTYHLGVRAEEELFDEDTNTEVISGEVVGDGSLPVEAPDRKVTIFV